MPGLFVRTATALAVALLLSGCGGAAEEAVPQDPVPSSLPLTPAEADTAVFAMGCFWCAETAFEGKEGVSRVTSGFAGGTVPNPTYDEVTAGGTGHYEVVQVIYAPDRISFEELLRLFWHNVDPLDAGGQFCDRGDSYRSAVFALTPEQRRLAEASKASLVDSGRFEAQVTTPVLDAAPFYPAEEYHQDFWLRDPNRYHSYRDGCRRDERLEELWGERAGVASDVL